MRGKSDSGAMQEKESVNQWAGPERGRAADDGEEHFEWRESKSGYCDDQDDLRWILYFAGGIL